jgi:hypothetical protein
MREAFNAQAYLFVADLNTVSESALQHLETFRLGRELCIGDTGGQCK